MKKAILAIAALAVITSTSMYIMKNDSGMSQTASVFNATSDISTKVVTTDTSGPAGLYVAWSTKLGKCLVWSGNPEDSSTHPVGEATDIHDADHCKNILPRTGTNLPKVSNLLNAAQSSSTTGSSTPAAASGKGTGPAPVSNHYTCNTSTGLYVIYSSTGEFVSATTVKCGTQLANRSTNSGMVTNPKGTTTPSTSAAKPTTTTVGSVWVYGDPREGGKKTCASVNMTFSGDVLQTSGGTAYWCTAMARPGVSGATAR